MSVGVFGCVGVGTAVTLDGADGMIAVASDTDGCGAGGVPPGSLAALERRAIEEALEQSRGNKSAAARKLGIPLSTFKRRLEELKSEQSAAVEGERRRADGERVRGDGLVHELSATREALTAERARADAMLASVPRRKRHLFQRPASGMPGDRTVGAPEGAVSPR